MSQMELPMRTIPRDAMLRERWKTSADAYWTAFVRMWRSVGFHREMDRVIRVIDRVTGRHR